MAEQPPSRMTELREILSDKAYALGWAVVKALPDSLACRIFDTAADVIAKHQPMTQLRKNLARVIGVAGPEDVPDELVRAAIRSYARYWREAFRLPSMRMDTLFPQLDASVEGKHHITDGLAKGKGVVLALPHSGNWDMAGVWLVHAVGTFSTVAERLKPESLYQRFVDYRESLGFDVIPLTGGSVPPMQHLKETLNRNGVICLLGERDLRARGVEVTFFGERTRMPAGPAKLATDTGAVLCPVHWWYTPDGWGMKVGDPVDTGGGVVATTQLLATAFEHAIAQHPEDWHLLQPLWLKDLSAGHLAHIEEGVKKPAEEKEG